MHVHTAPLAKETVYLTIRPFLLTTLLIHPPTTRSFNFLCYRALEFPSDPESPCTLYYIR